MGQRAAHLQRARQGRFQMLVVGGGVTGAGIARDAARRGISVLLVDKADLAWGTSSRSSKLVHGGLRYLETGQVGLVFESVSERRVLMDIAPHLVKPLGFVFPVYKGSRHSAVLLDIGMWIYDGLSLFRSPRIHKRLSRKAVAVEEPALLTKGLKAAELYYDCATDDARLTLETALDAVRAGATVVPWCSLAAFDHDEQGRVCGATVSDQFGGGSFQVTADVVVNATGPWTDSVRAMAMGKLEEALLRPTKGVHVVVDRARLPVRHAVVMNHPEDGRVLFAIPWGDRTFIGTTDTDWDGDPDLVAADSEDVDYLLQSAGMFFPDHPLERGDVLATWAGLRPLVRQDGVSESSVSREHQVLVERDALVTVAGGKLTTYRRMAAEVVDRAVDILRLSGRPVDTIRHAPTDREPLPGAVGWPEDDDEERLAQDVANAAAGSLDAAVSLNLVQTYGTLALDLAVLASSRPELASRLLPERPEIFAQVEWAATRELASTLEDVMVRRMPMFFKDRDQGLGCADAVADHMARLLGWSEERKREELDRYHGTVALARRWREPGEV